MAISSWHAEDISHARYMKELGDKSQDWDKIITDLVNRSDRYMKAVNDLYMELGRPATLEEVSKRLEER